MYKYGDQPLSNAPSYQKDQNIQSQFVLAKMPCPPVNYDNLASISQTYDPAKPIYMLNMFKYKEKAIYLPEHASLAGAPCSGKDAIGRYIAALQPLLPLNAARFFASRVLTEVLAPDGESWDDVVIVKYESLEGFKKMIESKEYVETAQPHKLAALDDVRLIMMDKVDV